MSFNKGGTIVSFPAGADLSSSIGLAVQRNAAGNVVLAPAVAKGAAILGFLVDSTPAADAAGKNANVQIDGIGEAITAAAVTAGDPLNIENAATARVETANVGTDNVVAVALESAAAANTTILVKIL